MFDLARRRRRPGGPPQLPFTVTPVEFQRSTILSPETPVGVERGLRAARPSARTATSRCWTATDGSGPYTVTAHDARPRATIPGQLNEAALRATSTTYPEEIKALYLAPSLPACSGPRRSSSRRRSSREAKSRRPVRPRRRRGQGAPVERVHLRHRRPRRWTARPLSTVECFATFKRGFCQYYAATMAVILRDLGVPTRIVEGFLPGARDGSAIGRGPLQQRPRLGRGLLPGVRLGDVRPDRRGLSPDRARCRRDRPCARRRRGRRSACRITRDVPTPP